MGWQKDDALNNPTFAVLFGSLGQKIKSILTGVKSHRIEGNKLIFTFMDGTTDTMTFREPKDGKDGDDGNDGVSITNVALDTRSHLIITLSTGRQIDAGSLASDSAGVLTEDLVVSNTIGTAKAGTKYAKGSNIEKIIRDMLIKIENPTVTFTINPTKDLYDKANETLSEITLNISATKKTNDVTRIEVFVNNQRVHIFDNLQSLTQTYKHTFSPATNSTFDLRVVVTDNQGLTGQATKQVVFVGKTYYGFVDKGIETPNAGEIKALQSTLKNNKTYDYKNIVMPISKVVYAYPKVLGTLSSIKDKENNINYTNSFARSDVSVDGIDYYCYILKEAVKVDGGNLSFE